MTDIEFEERLAEAERSIDRLYTHVLVLSGSLLFAVLVSITLLLRG